MATHARALALAPLARGSLNSSKHPSVDAFLKSLKLHTRTLGAIFAQHATELAVLERLHYLNNNQHRPALFWRRVVEARRYARRLRSFDVPLLVDGLRRSFYGSTPDTSSSKLKKGAWTHYPPTPFLKAFLTRLRTCTALLDKTYVRMRAIYHTLTLAMQSGAFLQLVVTLTALVARLTHLASALRSVLSTLHAECLHLFTTIHPTETSHDLAPLQPPPPPAAEGEDTKVSGRPLELIRRTVPDDDLDVSVDLGEVVARTPALDSQPQKSRSRSASPTLQETHDATRAPAAGARQPSERVPPDHVPRPSAPEPSPSQAVTVKKNRARPSPSSHTATEERKEKGRKRAKTRRDEIDDIFS